MSTRIATDCTGIKQLAITNVLSQLYQDQIEILLVKKEEFATPLTPDGFALTTKKRIQSIRKNNDEAHILITVTIQKGYYFLDGFWFLTACVGIAQPHGLPLCAMASSVPVNKTCSDKKDKDLSRNMSDILAEANPSWDKENDSAFTLLTGEEELPWIEQPLRHLARKNIFM